MYLKISLSKNLQKVIGAWEPQAISAMQNYSVLQLQTRFDIG